MDKKERFKLIPEVYLVLIKDGNILLSRRFQTGYEDGKYGMVAGHVDGNETMREALAREAKEEAGIAIDSSALEHLLTMHRWCPDGERIGFYFATTHWQGEIKNMEPQKCDHLSWFPLDQIPENAIPYIKTAIACCQSGQKYCEFGWDEISRDV